MAKRVEGRSDEASAAREAPRSTTEPPKGTTPRPARGTELRDIIEDFREEWGEAPTIRDLCRILGIERGSNAGDHLSELEKRGLLRRVPGGGGAPPD
jgi:SOS-response transcriptional repressor LexA